MFKRFFRDRKANVAILSSVMITSLVGVAGLVTEFGDGVLAKMQNQRVADAAAVAGAEIYASTKSSSTMSDAVNRIASLSGSTATISSQLVSSPSGDGNQAVEVTAQSSVPIAMAKLLWGQSSLPVSVSSYAEMKTLGPGGGTGCILALDPTASKAISFSGAANVQSPNCDVISNSSSSNAIDMSGAAQLTTPCTISVGGQTTTSGLDLTSCKKPYTGAPSGSDPYSGVANPSQPSTTCLTVPSPPTSIQPGYYCNGISISGSTAASFQSGFYYVKGGLSFSGSANISGTGVTFFVDQSGTVSISGSTTVTLSAPTSGTYSGILFFGDRSGTTSNSNTISGSSGSTLSGALYFPTQKFTYSGSSSGSGTCTQLIADTITFTGSTTMGAACSGAGVSAINVPGQSVSVALVQ